jgi:hypothetical protein
MVSEMRRLLDSLGLQQVKIYMPEVSNVDNRCEAYIDSVMKNPDSWTATAGFQTKSYNMSANWRMKETVAAANKPYFVAAGCNIIVQKGQRAYNPEREVDNDHYAADLCGRIFNDFNHMCSYWATYMGVEVWYDAEMPHKLIAIFHGPKSGIDSRVPVEDLVSLDDQTHLFITLKYHYYKHLSEAFDTGGVFRFCRASRMLPDYDMVYTFGQKPAINATTMQNPDGTWSIGLTNLTGCVSDTLDSTDWHPQTLFTYYPEDTFDITFTVEELKGHDDLYFDVYCSNKVKRMQKENQVVMKNGTFKIHVPPRELITLRSAKSAYISTRPGYAQSMAQIAKLRVSGKRHLALDVQKAGAYEVELYSMAGSMILKKDICAEKSGAVCITLPQRPAGVYICRISLSGSKIFERSILIR